MRYMIHSKTKQHVIVNDDYVAGGVWVIKDTDSEGWIPHTGTGCPLPDDCMVETKWNDGQYAPIRAAGVWKWTDPAITHYRPVLTEQAEPTPAPNYDPRSVSFNLLEQLAAAHEAAAKIPDIIAAIKAEIEKYGHTVVPLSPFVAAETNCCGNPSQCWEPCGDLGKDERYVGVVEPEAAPEPDMSDWRNWRKGDVLECSQPDVSFLFEGELATIEFINEYGDIFIKESPHGFRPQNFRFHSRPEKGGVMGRFTVKIRPIYDGRAMRPNAEQINGKTYSFMLGWVMDKDDPYPGETAWIPRDDTYPVDAPTWIASGDLQRHGAGE